MIAVGTRGADVRQLLFAATVYVEVIALVKLADDHALIDINARVDEKDAAIIEVKQSVLRDRAGAIRDHCAVHPA